MASGTSALKARAFQTVCSDRRRSLIERTPEGLYCRAAKAWGDPWRPVPRALITHAHADHARPGCGEYWAVASSEGVLRQRLGQDITLHPVAYGEEHWLGPVSYTHLTLPTKRIV